MVIETALLSFALTAIAVPPQLPPKAPKRPAPRIAQVQNDPRFTDFAKAVLNCYHPTARYQAATIVQRPWARQKEYGAKGSALVSIEYVGVSNTNYTIVVGVLGRPESIKTAIRSDTAVVHAYENCLLADWVEVK
jgi:hypothetical protein